MAIPVETSTITFTDDAGEHVQVEVSAERYERWYPRQKPWRIRVRISLLLNKADFFPAYVFEEYLKHRFTTEEVEALLRRLANVYP